MEKKIELTGEVGKPTVLGRDGEASDGQTCYIVLLCYSKYPVFSKKL